MIRFLVRRKQVITTSSLYFLISVGIFFGMFQPLLHTYRGLAIFSLPDTREQAYEWLVSNLPSDAKVLLDYRAPDLAVSPHNFQILRPPGGYALLWKPLSELKGQGFEYLVTSYVPSRFGESNLDSLYTSYESLFERYPPIAVFKPVPGKVKGPTLSVVRILSVDDTR